MRTFFAVLAEILKGIVGFAAWPFMRLRDLFVGRSEPAPDERQAAAAAAQRASAQEAQADASADERAQIQALRRCAAARVRGERLPEDAVEALSDQLDEYVQCLSVDECETIAKARTNALRGVVRGTAFPDGVRPLKDVVKSDKTSNVTSFADKVRERRAAQGQADPGEEFVNGWRKAV